LGKMWISYFLLVVPGAVGKGVPSILSGPILARLRTQSLSTTRATMSDTKGLRSMRPHRTHPLFHGSNCGCGRQPSKKCRPFVARFPFISVHFKGDKLATPPNRERAQIALTLLFQASTGDGNRTHTSEETRF
jgi:hypothetical protein